MGMLPKGFLKSVNKKLSFFTFSIHFFYMHCKQTFLKYAHYTVVNIKSAFSEARNLSWFKWSFSEICGRIRPADISAKNRQSYRLVTNWLPIQPRRLPRRTIYTWSFPAPGRHKRDRVSPPSSKIFHIKIVYTLDTPHFTEPCGLRAHLRLRLPLLGVRGEPEDGGQRGRGGVLVAASQQNLIACTPQ